MQDVTKLDLLIVRDQLRHILTPYALQRLRKQAALSINYTVEPVVCADEVPLAERTWMVKYVRPATQRQAAQVGAENEESADEEDAAAHGDERDNEVASFRIPKHVLHSDLGLDNEEYVCHEVTLSSCTCQLPKCSGLPDRHQIAVMQSLLTSQGFTTKDAHFDPESIAKLWLVTSHTPNEVRSFADCSHLHCAWYWLLTIWLLRVCACRLLRRSRHGTSLNEGTLLHSALPRARTRSSSRKPSSLATR